MTVAEDKKKIELGDYIEVAQRIADVREKLHPNGSFQPAVVSEPYSVQVIDGQAYIAVVAAFYRTPEDTMPGIGMAWEQVPGKTPYTRGSELQNAETSAWGRALVAALAADTKAGIASADEVRNRTAVAAANLPAHDFARTELLRLMNQLGKDSKAATAKFAADNNGDQLRTSTNAAAIEKLTAYYRDGGE
ncbi:hypothetical protein ACFWPK_33195 [Nocardia sp. NPDC058519]|uniref:hypothetical protein n=1 Tax=Nocardia sp. NPDC058519 TaxID=3346535 RepID=UPI00366579FB